MEKCIHPVIVFMVVVLPMKLLGQSAYNPNTLPLGDKEALMGNTGTGGIKSPGAVYYNPGALTTLEGNSFSLSGSAYMRFEFEAKPIAKFGDTNLDYNGNGFQTTPTSVIMVKKYKEWYVGFSVLVPMEFNYEGQTEWNVPVENVNLKLNTIQNYREKIFLAGLSVARKINESWSVGLTMYAQKYTYLSTIDLHGEFVEAPQLMSQTTNRETISPFSLLIIAGLHKKFEKSSLGLRIALPSIPLFGEGDYYNYEFSSMAGVGQITTSTVDVKDKKAKFVTPLDVCLGASFFPNDKLTFAIDLAYRLGIDYYPFEDHSVADKIMTKGNFRINSGFESRVSDRIALCGGGSYTPSTLEEVEGTITQDYWGAFAGGKLFTTHLQTSLGLFYSQGKGEGDLAVGIGRTTQTHETLGVFLGTTYTF